jgi:hypothetical protein
MSTTNIWDEVSSSSKGSAKLLNGGFAGDATVDVVVENNAGKVKDNGEPIKALFAIHFTDTTRPEARSIRHDIYDINDDINSATPADTVKANFNLKKMNMNMARAVFEAICPGEELPVQGTARDIINAIYSKCAAKGSPTSCRAFFHYGKKNKPDTWLNWNFGFNKSIVNSADTTTVFEPTAFMNRPRPDAETTTADVAGGAMDMSDSLPF